MMDLNALSRNPATSRLLAMRSKFEDLQRQLATGMRSETFGGLGPQRSVSVDFRQRLSELDSFKANTERLQLRTKLLDRGLERMSALPIDVRAGLDPNSFELRQDGRTDGQKAARMALDEVIGLLNTQADGRYLYSGKDTGTRPVLDANAILFGDGGKAGLNQVVAERWTADQGAAGLGRLTMARVGADVSFGREQPVADAYGIRISEVFSTSPAVSVSKTTTAVGSDTFVSAATLSFTGTLAVGETITVDLVNPDGTTGQIRLTATATAPPKDGEFLASTVADDTAASFETQFAAALSRYVASDLRAASGAQASEEFFDTEGGVLPLRTPSATATAPVSGTATNTVLWYQGYDDANNPRDDAKTRIDSYTSVSYGVRANEPAFRQMVQSLALASVATFTAGPNEADRYRATMDRARDGLAYVNGTQQPSEIHAEIAYAANAATKAAERNAVTQLAMTDLLDGVEGVVKEEVAAMILELQTMMQASYQTTAILKDLSLVNYI